MVRSNGISDLNFEGSLQGVVLQGMLILLYLVRLVVTRVITLRTSESITYDNLRFAFKIVEKRDSCLAAGADNREIPLSWFECGNHNV